MADQSPFISSSSPSFSSSGQSQHGGSGGTGCAFSADPPASSSSSSQPVSLFTASPAGADAAPGVQGGRGAFLPPSTSSVAASSSSSSSSSGGKEPPQKEPDSPESPFEVVPDRAAFDREFGAGGLGQIPEDRICDFAAKPRPGGFASAKLGGGGLCRQSSGTAAALEEVSKCVREMHSFTSELLTWDLVERNGDVGVAGTNTGINGGVAGTGITGIAGSNTGIADTGITGIGIAGIASSNAGITGTNAGVAGTGIAGADTGIAGITGTSAGITGITGIAGTNTGITNTGITGTNTRMTGPTDTGITGITGIAGTNTGITNTGITGTNTRMTGLTDTGITGIAGTDTGITGITGLPGDAGGDSSGDSDDTVIEEERPPGPASPPPQKGAPRDWEELGEQPPRGKSAAPLSPGEPLENPAGTRLLPRLAARDLLFWRDARKTGVAFGASLLLLLSLATLSAVSVVAHLALALLSVTISLRVYKAVVQAVQKAEEGHPFRAYLDLDVTLSPETFQAHVAAVAVHLNRALRLLLRLFLVEDLVDSMKLAVAMWLLTYVGAVFNGITLLILAEVLAFTVPPLYEKYKVQIDHYVGVVRSQTKDIMDKIQAKLPGLAKKKPE